MAHPALQNMSYDELAGLIEEAKAVMAEKFPTEVTPQKPYLMGVEQAQDQQLDITEVEQAADPFRSPTAQKKGPLGEGPS